MNVASIHRHAIANCLTVITMTVTKLRKLMPPEYIAQLNAIEDACRAMVKGMRA